MGCEFHRHGAVTLSTLVATKANGDPSGKELYTLYIRIPPGASGEASSTVTVAGTALTLSTDTTRWEYDYVTLRSGQYTYNFQCVDPYAADEEKFNVVSSVFA